MDPDNLKNPDVILNEKKKILISGHRGYRAKEIENTGKAFQRAIDEGLDFIEFDVRKTSDGIPIIFHDSKIDRLLNGNGLIERKSLDELKKMKYSDGQSVQTLDEMLEQTAGKIGLMLEIKSAGIEEKILSLLEHYNALDSTIVQSFNMGYIKNCKKINPDLRYGLCMIFLGNLGGIGKILGLNTLIARIIVNHLIKSLHVSYLNLDGPFISDEFIKIALKNDLNIILGAMKTSEYLDRLEDWGVKIVNADDPRDIVNTIKNRFSDRFLFSKSLKT